MQLGFYPDMSEEVYHRQAPGYSKTSLCVPTPFDYWAERIYTGEKPDNGEKPSFLFGSLFHTMKGEPEELGDRYVKNEGLHPDGGDKILSKNSKAYEAWKEENPDKKLITPKMWADCERMVKMLSFNPVANQLYEKPGYSECSFVNKCPETGVYIRCRPDRMWNDFSVVADLKTTGDGKAGPSSFPWEASKLHYHVSAALTTDIIEQITGIRPRYFFVVIEKPFPHRSAVWEATEKALSLGRKFYRNRIKLLELCKSSGYFPTYISAEKQYEKPHELFNFVEEL
ncbi:MAG: PD-(D/E)XK nuclease-like domain-containing protein [Oligoflexales bacterium]|nr:PD-(D/E)XK nuclease-like domain-containing protein [Oligoflexales bacterium]